MSKQLTADLAITPVSPILFKTTNVNPPSNLYVTREDILVITSINSAAGLTVTVRGRIMEGNGRVVPFSQDHIPNSNRTAATTLIPIGEGFLLDVAVFLTAGTAKRGQCYVQLTLGRGDLAARLDFQVILQGYVGNSVNQAWPGNRLETPTEGPGWIHTVVGTQPPAGSQISQTVPTGARWRIISFGTQLVTAVAVANRQVQFALEDATPSVVWLTPAFVNQAASLTVNYVWGANIAVFTPVETVHQAGPLGAYLIALGGYIMITGTIGMQAADQFSAPTISVEEWIEP